MRLWQKVCIVSLTIMLVTAEILSLLILSRNFSMVIERERSRAVSTHESLAAGVTNQVVYHRLKESKIFLDPDETAEILAELLALNPQITLYDGERPVGSENEVVAANSGFRRAAAMAEDCRVVIVEHEGGSYLLTGSTLVLEGHSYGFFTLSDMTGLYAQQAELLRFAQWSGVLAAFCLAVVLLLIMVQMLRPLYRINKTIREIAEGHYALRLPETGGVEFAQLSRNINSMSASIEEKVEELRRVADGRKQFIDSLAHEMKTPLTSIVGFADILRVKRTVTERQRREFSGIIIDEARRLGSLSGKLLELATTSNTEMELRTVAVDELFREIYHVMLPVLQHREVELVAEAEEGLVLRADVEIFKSLLYNLIDNAAKASERGGRVCLNGVLEGNRAVLSVSDNGIGMKQEDIERATDPFYMADKSRSRKSGGVGLGLSLCVEIAKRHGGSLRMESRAGEGTTVFVSLPIGEGAE